MKIAIVYDMIYPFNIGGAELRNYESDRSRIFVSYHRIFETLSLAPFYSKDCTCFKLASIPAACRAQFNALLMG